MPVFLQVIVTAPLLVEIPKVLPESEPAAEDFPEAEVELKRIAVCSLGQLEIDCTLKLSRRELPVSMSRMTIDDDINET
jgi:hypothetical protein